ncbi:unnamed protein product [Rotaria sp. Silwood1]|nr:unnamed protein product [Rotaria sp. Silwood1]
MAFVMVFVLLLLILLYFYLKRKYFTPRKDLPGLEPQFLFGNLIQTGIIPNGVSVAQALTTFKQRYGDIFQFWLGPSYYVVINDIVDVQHIFTNRHIYEQGEVFIQQASILFSDGLICTKGDYETACFRETNK